MEGERFYIFTIKNAFLYILQKCILLKFSDVDMQQSTFWEIRALSTAKEQEDSAY